MDSAAASAEAYLLRATEAERALQQAQERETGLQARRLQAVLHAPSPGEGRHARPQALQSLVARADPHVAEKRADGGATGGVNAKCGEDPQHWAHAMQDARALHERFKVSLAGDERGRVHTSMSLSIDARLTHA